MKKEVFSLLLVAVLILVAVSSAAALSGTRATTAPSGGEKTGAIAGQELTLTFSADTSPTPFKAGEKAHVVFQTSDQTFTWSDKFGKWKGDYKVEGKTITFEWDITFEEERGAATAVLTFNAEGTFYGTDVGDVTGVWSGFLPVQTSGTLTAVISNAPDHVKANTQVTVDGSQSTPSNAIVDWKWTVDPGASTQLLPSGKGISFTASPDQVGKTYSVTLTIKDSAGQTSSASVEIKVYDKPIAKIHSVTGLTRKVGTSIASVVQLESDSTGGFLTQEWTLVSAPEGAKDVHNQLPSSVGPTFVTDAEGDYVIKLTVKNWGGESSDTITITAVKVLESVQMTRSEKIWQTNPKDGKMYCAWLWEIVNQGENDVLVGLWVKLSKDGGKTYFDQVSAHYCWVENKDGSWSKYPIEEQQQNPELGGLFTAQHGKKYMVISEFHLTDSAECNENYAITNGAYWRVGDKLEDMHWILSSWAQAGIRIR